MGVHTGMGWFYLEWEWGRRQILDIFGSRINKPVCEGWGREIKEETKCLVWETEWRKELAAEFGAGWRKSMLGLGGGDKAGTRLGLQGWWHVQAGPLVGSLQLRREPWWSLAFGWWLTAWVGWPLQGLRGSLESWEEKHQHLRRKWKGRWEEMQDKEPGEDLSVLKSLLGRNLWFLQPVHLISVLGPAVSWTSPRESWLGRWSAIRLWEESAGSAELSVSWATPASLGERWPHWAPMPRLTGRAL